MIVNTYYNSDKFNVVTFVTRVKNCGRCKAADPTTCTAEPPEETTTGTGIRPVVVVEVIVVVVVAAAVVVEIVNHTLLSATYSDQPNRPELDLLSPVG